MLTVAVVYSGGNYKKEHVHRLRKQLIGRLNQPYQFVCLEDSPFPGFWAKISLFEPGRFSGRVLYLDLDVDIVGNLDEIVDFPWPFGIIKEWNGPGVNSSVMVWDAGTADHLFTRFKKEYISGIRYLGDQNYIGDKMISTAKFPKVWCLSYKTHIRPAGKIPEETKVICYHGAPKPWDI